MKEVPCYEIQNIKHSKKQSEKKKTLAESICSLLECQQQIFYSWEDPEGATRLRQREPGDGL